MGSAVDKAACPFAECPGIDLELRAPAARSKDGARRVRHSRNPSGIPHPAKNVPVARGIKELITLFPRLFVVSYNTHTHLVSLTSVGIPHVAATKKSLSFGNAWSLPGSSGRLDIENPCLLSFCRLSRVNVLFHSLRLPWTSILPCTPCITYHTMLLSFSEALQAVPSDSLALQTGAGMMIKRRSRTL